MANISNFEVFGPKSTLQRMGELMLNETPHAHYFSRDIADDLKIWVFVYEDQVTTVQSSRCVTCILSEQATSVHLEIADVGKQSGFRNLQEPDEQPVYDQIVEFILDYSKQHGLTVQNLKEV